VTRVSSADIKVSWVYPADIKVPWVSPADMKVMCVSPAETKGEGWGPRARLPAGRSAHGLRLERAGIWETPSPSSTGSFYRLTARLPCKAAEKRRVSSERGQRTRRAPSACCGAFCTPTLIGSVAGIAPHDVSLRRAPAFSPVWILTCSQPREQHSGGRLGPPPPTERPPRPWALPGREASAASPPRLPPRSQR